MLKHGAEYRGACWKKWYGGTFWVVGFNIKKYLHTQANISHQRNRKAEQRKHMWCVWLMSLPARMALCAWNSWPATHREQSVKREFSQRPPSSSASRQSGTFTIFIVFCPDMLTESCTTLTWKTDSKDFIRSTCRGNHYFNPCCGCTTNLTCH